MGQVEAAMNDFETAQSLRLFDAYTVSCVGISLVYYGLHLIAEGNDTLGREKTRQGLGELTTAVVVVSRNSQGDELVVPDDQLDHSVEAERRGSYMGSDAYDPFFLRGKKVVMRSVIQHGLMD